jgi:hypothetical protein
MAKGNGKQSLTSQQETQRILEKASYFVIFSVPDPQSLSVGTPLIPFIPQTVYRIDITEAPRLFQVRTEAVTARCGIRATKSISRRQIANQRLEMEVTPNNYQSGPGRTPPPTLLLPFLSQRFWMLNGNFDFLDGLGTGFRAIAGGRFFPAGGTSLWIGGVAEITEGLGQLAGFQGNLAIDGQTTPPAEFANAFLFRFIDLEGKLSADSLPPVEPEAPDPDYSESAMIPLLADLKPSTSIEVETIAGSSKKRVRMVERLRLVDTNFDVRPGFLKSHNVVKAEVGERHTTLVFDPDDENDTIPVYSTASEFRFVAEGKSIGRLEANLFEGRAFRTTLPGLAQPFFRIVGFGPYGEGTGQFQSLDGMMVMNGALSLEPGAFSSMYLLRIRDPQRRFQSQTAG